MISKESVVQVIDNSGAKTATCIGFHGGARRSAALGDIIVVSIQRCVSSGAAAKRTIKSKRNVKDKRVVKGEVCLAVVVQSRQPTRRPSGERVTFHDSAVVLVNDKGVPRGTRILASVAIEAEQHVLKVVALAPHVA